MSYTFSATPRWSVNSIKHILTVLCSLGLLFEIQAAEFRNLGFDEANISNLIEVADPTPRDRYLVGTMEDLLPGWNITRAGNLYNGPVSYPAARPILPAVDGCDFCSDGFSFTYQTPWPDRRPEFDISLWQIGRVPADAQDLASSSVDFLYMNGIALVSRPVERGKFNERHWDVREFAGQEVKFEIRTSDGRNSLPIRLDIFGFTTPEPAEWALLVTGGAVLYAASRRGAGRAK